MSCTAQVIWSDKAKAVFAELGESYARDLIGRGVDGITGGSQVAIVVEGAFLTRMLELGRDQDAVDESVIEAISAEFTSEVGGLSETGFQYCDAVLFGGDDHD